MKHHLAVRVLACLVTLVGPLLAWLEEYEAVYR